MLHVDGKVGNDQPLEYAPPTGWSESMRSLDPTAVAGQRSASPWRQLLTLPAVVPVLGELLSEPRWGHVPPRVPAARRAEWRLDHDYVDVKPGYTETADKSPAGDGNLHGGIHAHHVTCVFELRTVQPGDGGFACVAGSHSPAFRWPAGCGPGAVAGSRWRELEGGEFDERLGVRVVSAAAGDCIVFSEKLSHATAPWRGIGRSRRSVFFKFVPFGMHHGDARYDITDPGLSPTQAARLRFPDKWFNSVGKAGAEEKQARGWAALLTQHAADGWPTMTTAAEATASARALL